MTVQEKPPEPGEVVDTSLGIPGEAEPFPEDDAEQDEPTLVNEDEELRTADSEPLDEVLEEEPDQTLQPYEVHPGEEVDNG